MNDPINQLVQDLSKLDQIEAGLREGDAESIRMASELIQVVARIGTPDQLSAMLAGVRLWAEAMLKAVKKD